MPDWADRFEGDRRPRHQPGTNFQYSDVRVNVAALALLHVWRRRALPSAPETAFYASGGSSNRLYVDPENDLVIAVRWIDGSRFDEVVGRVLASLR